MLPIAYYEVVHKKAEEYYGKEITPQTEMVLWINDWIKALNTIKEELVQKNDTEMVALFSVLSTSSSPSSSCQTTQL